MTRIELNRRAFLKGCCATAAVGAVGPAMFYAGDAHAAVNPYDTVVHWCSCAAASTDSTWSCRPRATTACTTNRRARTSTSPRPAPTARCR